jgi:2-oxoglutarate dehydrogenase E2 component (dihydrolipoamide succinyltransferase)
MSIEIKVPNLPESVSSATVATWHVKAGDKVTREQNLVDLETDKVMLEVPATADGVLKEIRIQPGATVSAGDIIGILEEGAAAGSPAPQETPVMTKGEAARELPEFRRRKPEPGGAQAAVRAGPVGDRHSGQRQGRSPDRR